MDLGRRIDSAAAEKFAEERGLVYFETSARLGSLELMDFCLSVFGLRLLLHFVPAFLGVPRKKTGTQKIYLLQGS